MIFLVVSIPIANNILNFLTHQHMKRFFSIAQLSNIHYHQQKRMTLLLIGQGSLPLMIPVLVAIIIVPSLPGIMDGRSPSKFTYEFGLCTVVMYPVLSPILTIALIRPYNTPIKLILRKIAFKRKRSVSIIKF